MKALTAKRAVLYQGRMYEPGDVLPAGDSRMVEAWLQAESAEWTGVAQGAAQEAQGEPGTDNGTQEGQEGQGAAEDALDAQEGQGAAEGTLDVVDGHLTRESLETMTKANLEKLAKEPKPLSKHTSVMLRASVTRRL